MNIYQLTYDNTQTVDKIAFHNLIKNSPDFPDWWHYLPNVYLLESRITASDISNKIMSAFPGIRIFVVKVDLNAYNGYLNKGAWEWIRKKNNQKIRLKTMPLKVNPVQSAIESAIAGYNAKPLTPNVDALVEALLKNK